MSVNEHGLTVTINAGKSDLPLKAKTPVSLVTKDDRDVVSTVSAPAWPFLASAAIRQVNQAMDEPCSIS